MKTIIATFMTLKAKLCFLVHSFIN